MRIGRSSEGRVRTTKSETGGSKRSIALLGVLVVTIVLIFWVYTMGRKAEETVSVVMLNESVYKNQAITEASLKEYKMLKGEFEKYATSGSDGTKKRRIILWSERDKIINKSFAAYPLQSDTVLMWNTLIKSRVDNSDTVMYSFPNKEIVSLDVADKDLKTFKAYLQPGDRVNITAIFSSSENIRVENSDGSMTSEKVEVFKQETMLKDVMIADLLNNKGKSILDLYASYNDKTSYQQARLDSDEAWLESVEPKSMLIALTPEENERYNEYKCKNGVEFHMSLPQRED